MIISFVAQGELHAVHVIHQQGMTKIGATGMCTIEEAVGKGGVYQVGDWVFDGRPKYGEIPVCAKCAQVVARAKVPPP